MLGDMQIVIKYNRMSGEITDIKVYELDGDNNFVEIEWGKVPLIELMGVLETTKIGLYESYEMLDLDELDDEEEDEEDEEESIEWFTSEEEEEEDEEGGETLGV